MTKSHNNEDIERIDPQELVDVYSVTSAETAELIRATLKDEGIACWISGETQGGFAGVLPITLMVSAADVDRAFAVIKTFDH